MSELLTATHEAGHAVMSVRMREELDYISIVPTNEYDGVCSAKDGFIAECEWYSKCKDYSDYKEYLEKMIMILFAGHIAEGKNNAPMNWRELGIESDMDTAFALVLGISGNEKQAGKEFDKLWDETIDIISQPIAQLQIKAVADALIKRKTLSGDEVRGIIEGVKGMRRK